MTYTLMLTATAVGKHIQTIKAVRGATGLGLKESKGLADACRDTKQPQALRVYDSVHDADEALRHLTQEGYATGHIASETTPTERTYGQYDVTLMLADAISAARNQVATPSAIIRSILNP